MVARVEFTVGSPEDFGELRRRFTALPMRPKLVQGRAAGTDISSPGRQSQTLLIGEETGGALYATDVYLSPGFGAPSHHQPTEDELWYLLEGELDVRVGARRMKIRAGSFAYIPRDTTHAFKNNGQGPARLLAWNAPGGHERAFEEMGRLAKQGITAFPDLRQMFHCHGVELHADENQSARSDHAAGPRVVPDRLQAPDAGWSGADARLLLSDGNYEVFDVRLNASLSRLEERGETCVYIVGGEARISVGSETQEVGRGAFAFVPRGTPLGIAGSTQFLLWIITDGARAPRRSAA